MNTSIFFRRATKVVVNTTIDSGYFNFREVATLDANLRTLGYTLSGDLAKALMKSSIPKIKSVAETLVSEGKAIKGVRAYRPMYKNFPNQVMETSAAELYLNAFMHYWSGGILFPVHSEQARPELDFDESKYTVVNLGTATEFANLMRDLMASKSAFSETDRNDINSLGDNLFQSLVANGDISFANRENKAYVSAIIINRKLNDFLPKADTATDVLRLAVALSDGDISLAEKTKFRKFSRSERRRLIAMLDSVGNPVEDMFRNQAAWKRLGEVLHPGDYAKRYGKAYQAFSAVRNDETHESFNSRIEASLAISDIDELVHLLSTRPGEFARRLDHVLRIANDKIYVLKAFKAVAKEVSPTVLIQTRQAFINRDKDYRVFMPMGSVSKMQMVADKRVNIHDQHAAQAIVIINDALINVFSKRESLGKVYIDDALRGVGVPFALRNSSAAVKTLARGSRIPLDADTNTLRFFIWWKNMEDKNAYSNRVDIDLSAQALDKDFQNAFYISYYNLEDSGSAHSGDIVTAPNGASEFIDIDIARAKAKGARYIVMTVHSFTGQTFDTVPECSAGFMQRPDGRSGEVYDPRTVTNRVDLTSKSTAGTPFVFDLETMEAVWTDMNFAATGSRVNNLHTTKDSVKNVTKGLVELNPPSLYDLFALHTLGRGTRVDSPEDADVMFDLQSAFDTEDILANYL